MTTREAAIVSAYTRYLVGIFVDMHRYVAEIMGRPVFDIEMGDQQFADDIREKAKPDFLSLAITP